MVFVDDKCLQAADFYGKWARRFAESKLETEERAQDLLFELYKKYVPALLDYIYLGRNPNKEQEASMKQVIERTPLSLLK